MWRGCRQWGGRTTGRTAPPPTCSEKKRTTMKLFFNFTCNLNNDLMILGIRYINHPLNGINAQLCLYTVYIYIYKTWMNISKFFLRLLSYKPGRRNQEWRRTACRGKHCRRAQAHDLCVVAYKTWAAQPDLAARPGLTGNVTWWEPKHRKTETKRFM